MLSSTSSTSSTGTGVPASTNVPSLMPASPNAETCDESSNRFTLYLHRLAGHADDQENHIPKDHCYARPWNWKPENIYVKPVKKIFFSKAADSKQSLQNAEDYVEVEESPAEDVSVPYDFTRSRHQMDEFQRLANFARPEEDDGDWEEKIEKISWLPVHHRIFSKVMRILTSERLARLAKSSYSTEPIFRRNSVDTAARRFRETLASTGWNLKMTQWLHGLLFENLPREYLAIYLDILQTLRLKLPQLIDRMMSVQPSINGKSGSITWETLGSLLKRSWDPLAPSLNSYRPTKLPGNPILIVAPSGINTNVSSRQHKWITQLGNLGMIVNVHAHVGVSANRMTMMTCMDQLVQATRTKIQDVRVDCPGRPIVMIGFNSGAALACQVAQMEHVTAVICLGFPFTTVDGKRGTPDDTLMDMRCPVMFVIGENASLVTANDLEDVREKMLVETSLLVVGTADDHLRISSAKKISNGITQAIVDRCIMNEIGDFIASILLQPHPLPLRSVALPSCENARSTKKEPRKRKVSTSSSVDSESNSPNVKKSRPPTPVTSSTISSNNSAPITVPPRPLALGTTQSTLSAPLSSGVTSHATQTSIQKKKTKVNNCQKYNFADKIISSRSCAQQTTSSNGGITLNIGSLASLAPIGPIKLAPTGMAQTLTPPLNTNLKANFTSRSPMNLAKIPKIVQTKTPQLSNAKSKTNVQIPGKGLSKVIPPNYNAIGNDLKSVNTPTTVSVNAASQTKMNVNTSPSGSLTTLIQSGKNTLGVVGTNSIAPHSVPTSSGSILLTSSISSGSISGTISSAPTSKVTEVGTGIDGDTSESGIPLNSTTKTHQVECTGGSSRMLLPITNKTPITILPLSGQRAKALGKSHTKAVPKITLNSHNLHKSHCALQTTFSLKKSLDIDEDLGNILDIPIIFAKDGESLGLIEKTPTPTAQMHVEPPEKTIKRLGPTTKVVLISNKQDRTKTINQSNTNFVRPSISNQITTPHQVILHPRSSQTQSPISIATDWHGLPLQTVPRSNNQSTIKYTKIILAKRNSDIANNSTRNEPIVLTKTISKVANPTIQEKTEHRYAAPIPITVTTSNPPMNEALEIEDVIKTNIIERKFVTIPEIDLTSPIKKQAVEETSTLTNVTHQTDTDCIDAPKLINFSI